MKKNKIDMESPRFLKRSIVYIIVWGCLLGSYPYIFNQLLPVPRLSLLCLLTVVCLFLTVIYRKNKLKTFSKSINYIALIQIIGWLFFIIIHRDMLYIERISYIIVAYFMLLCLYNCRGRLYRFFNKYNKFITFMAIGGTIIFLLVLMFNIPFLKSFANKDGREALFYGLTSTNFKIGNIIRYSGYFDEPGAMAYWGIWALLYNKLFYNDIRIEKYLMIFLCFTLSMAYYIQLAAYIFLFKLKTAKQILLTVIIISSLGIGIFYLSHQNPTLYNLTFKRFEINDSGEVVGDNRSNLAELAKIEFQKSPVFGNGISRMSSKEYMSDNPYDNLAYDGIIGTILTYLPFLYLFYKGNYTMRFCIIILIIGFLQRPFHHYIIFQFMTYGLLILSLTESRKLKRLNYEQDHTKLNFS